MKKQLLTKLPLMKPNCDEEQYEEYLCKIMADFCLDSGRKASQFQNQFLKQMVAQAKMRNPDFSFVRLSVSTGINRRYIPKLLAGEDLYKHQPKEDTVLKYIYSYCSKNNTTRIKKKGAYETFQYYCLIAANGTLTHQAIAQELIAQGKIIDDGRYYKIKK